ncbi:MAG: hypothetical protein V4466_06900 [Pseudomonadota bacterium]
MNRGLVLLLATVAIGGCQREGAPSRAEAPAPKAAPRPGEWAFGMGRNSVEMVHLPTGKPESADLRLVCAQGDGFLVVLPTFKAVASEERLTIGAGGEAHALAATAAPRGIQASGPVSEGLLAAIESGAPISVNHGAQSAGPFVSPPEALRRAFADSCRGFVRRGEI